MKRKHRTSRRHTRRNSFPALVLLIILATVALLAAFLLRPGANHSLPDEEVVGIDVSHYQHRIDYSKLCFNFSLPSRKLSSEPSAYRRDVDFVIAKATEGTRYVDDCYAYNRRECRSRRIPFGAYHYFQPLESPRAQAEHFIKVASLRKGDLVPVVDVEQWGHLTMAQLKGRVLEFCEVLEQEYGRKPLIYCNLAYYYLYFCNPSFKDYDFWIAAYSRRFILARHVLWQTSDQALAGGTGENVDLDVFDGSKAEFNEKMFL